jgi:hypothetical protein
VCHVYTGFGHDTRTFVAERNWPIPLIDRKVTGEVMDIRSADACGTNLDDNFSRPGGWFCLFLYDQSVLTALQPGRQHATSLAD